MEKESYHHSWNGLFLGQIYSKGVTRSDAERLELYFEDSTGEVKRVDSVGFVTDVECNITGIVLKNDPKKCGKSKKKIVAKKEEQREEENDSNVEKAEEKEDKPAAKKTKAATEKKTTTKRAKKTKENKDEK